MTSLAAGGEGEDGLVAAEAQEQRAALLAVLDALHVRWMEKAETGDPAAAAIVLAVCKQRAALLGLARGASPALRVAATAGGADKQAGREVKVVVEYVNDWREVLRRRGYGDGEVGGWEAGWKRGGCCCPRRGTTSGRCWSLRRGSSC